MSNPERDPRLTGLLESAALLQKLVPEAVLVGGSAAALYAGHRLSFDHDHVVTDLENRFHLVLEALETDPEFVVNRLTPGKIILGEHDGIEYDIRQLIRVRPLEIVEEVLPSGRKVKVPTIEEVIRIKAYLIVKRNWTRDYLDLAALASIYGFTETALTLTSIDDFYSDPTQEQGSVATQLLSMLLEPSPRDKSMIRKLKTYKNLNEKWHNWNDICEVLSTVAIKIGG